MGRMAVFTHHGDTLLTHDAPSRIDGRHHNPGRRGWPWITIASQGKCICEFMGGARGLMGPRLTRRITVILLQGIERAALPDDQSAFVVDQDTALWADYSC